MVMGLITWGAIVVHCKCRNGDSGDIYGEIHASRIAAHLEIPTRFNDDYELPTSFPYFEAMPRHGFIEYGTSTTKKIQFRDDTCLS